MSFLKKLFGERKSAPSETEVLQITGNGSFGMEVFSVPFYEENLERICGPRTEQGENRVMPARLHLEDNNPKDPEAVRVEISGYQVGYLSRSFAHQYRQQLKRAGHPRAMGECQARITGGSRRRGGGRAGHYAVWLDIVEAVGLTPG